MESGGGRQGTGGTEGPLQQGVGKVGSTPPGKKREPNEGLGVWLQCAGSAGTGRGQRGGPRPRGPVRGADPQVLLKGPEGVNDAKQDEKQGSQGAGANKLGVSWPDLLRKPC